MKIIHYNVSGKVMEILQQFLSFIIKEFGLTNLAPLLSGLGNGNFNLQNFLSNLKLENLMPIISTFMNVLNKNPTETVGIYHGLTPIENIADKEIVLTLNNYFGSN